MPDITTYYIDRYKRHLLTGQNLVELGIADAVDGILMGDKVKVGGVAPDGLSINESFFGAYMGQTAAKLGRMAYMDIGEPLIEERADIVQPPPDVLSSRTYENRSRYRRDFKDIVEFSVSNTVSWSLRGTGQLTFGSRTSAELEAQLQKNLQHSSMQAKSHTDIDHNHRDNSGGETQDQTESSVSDSETGTASGTASGTGELFAQLMLGITGSVSGSVTASSTSSSEMSGVISWSEADLPSRMKAIVTQRRQVRQYFYELPITLAGFVVLHYPRPVTASAASTGLPGEQSGDYIAMGIANLGLGTYRPKGIAETVSAIHVDHTLFHVDEWGFDRKMKTGEEAFETVRPHYL